MAGGVVQSCCHHFCANCVLCAVGMIIHLSLCGGGDGSCNGGNLLSLLPLIVMEVETECWLPFLEALVERGSTYLTTSIIRK